MTQEHHSKVPADQVREHLLTLHAAGLSWAKIAELAQVAVTTVRRIAIGTGTISKPRDLPTLCSWDVARLVMGVKVPQSDLAAGLARVDSTGTRRRLQALMYCGWSIPLLCQDSGLERQALDNALSGGRVAAATARAVMKTYDRLWDVAPPQATAHERASVARNRNRALLAGWLPPMEWDDDLIDDPTYVPSITRTVKHRGGDHK